MTSVQLDHHLYDAVRLLKLPRISHGPPLLIVINDSHFLQSLDVDQVFVYHEEIDGETFPFNE